MCAFTTASWVTTLDTLGAQTTDTKTAKCCSVWKFCIFYSHSSFILTKEDINSCFHGYSRHASCPQPKFTSPVSAIFISLCVASFASNTTTSEDSHREQHTWSVRLSWFNEWSEFRFSRASECVCGCVSMALCLCATDISLQTPALLKETDDYRKVLAPRPSSILECLEVAGH